MACDTYSLIKFFVFQLLYLSQRHIEYMLMAWIYLAFQDSIFKSLKVGPVNHTQLGIEESERMSASSYAD